MTSSAQRPPWETSSWRSFRAPAPEVRPDKSIGTLGVIAIAIGVAAFGAYALDLHSHVCEACGNRWRHLGAFNMGDPVAHTCKQCGTVQWWKDGFQHVFRDPSQVATGPTSPAGQWQEIRQVPPSGLPSWAPTGPAPGVPR
jgi:hypothetical protein